MTKKLGVVLAAVFIAVSVAAAPKRRSINPPPIDTTTPAGWLAANAYVFTASESNGDVSDLAAIGPLIGDATLVGLGDGTHGTHEYFVAKRRIIEYLVRNKDFDEVDFEGEYPAFRSIDAYINGAPGDAKQLVISPTDAYYFFWEMQELVDLIEWMRDYNLHRPAGARAIHTGGFDVYGLVAMAPDVIAYLDRVDPAAATAARTNYACLSKGFSAQCVTDATGVKNDLAAHAQAYAAASSQREYDDALHEATMIAEGTVGQRDQRMAANALWLRDHHSATHKTILWAHQEHVGRLTQVLARSMGSYLTEAARASYFTFGNATLDGTFLTNPNPSVPPAATAFLPLTSDGYELNFRAAGAARVIIPLRGALPKWLADPHHLRAGDAGDAYDRVENLPQKFDAVIYIEHTTPNHWVR